MTAVKFGHNARDLLACSSKDGTLSVCVLSTQPPSVKCMLHGHKAAVNGEACVIIYRQMCYILPAVNSMLV